MSEGTRPGPERPEDAIRLAAGGLGAAGGTDPTTVTGHDSHQREAAPPDTGNEVIDVRRGMFGVHGAGDTTGYGGLVRRVQMPGAAQRPYGGWFDQAADALEVAVPAYDRAVERVVIHRDQLIFYVRREHLVDFMRTLRDDPALRFEVCLGTSGVHYPEDEGRELHAVYPMLSMTHNRRLLVEVACPDADPHIPSVVPIYPGNNWHERETYDFFGIIFDGHPSLTRIEMPDDWPGHPQRKDYPLGGIPVEYKGARVPPPDKRRTYT
ncbi:MAG: NADH-quinone oxidoreductase subunit C [Actinomycetota bacterium]|nr:NADH-quinone oxidoreductase subunit C [Actinomycetota bacterium]